MNKKNQQVRQLAERSDLPMQEDTQRRIPQRMKLDKIDKSNVEMYKKTPADEMPLKILIITWNLMGGLPGVNNLDRLLTKERLQNDLIVIGTQECQRTLFASFFCESKQTWEEQLNQKLQKDFFCIGSDVLQGLHSIAFIKRSLRDHVSDLKKGRIKTGFMGVIGNKGAIELEFKIGSKHFLFVNAHLQAMQEESQRRNHDLLQVVHRFVDTQPADQVYFFGDLNYRVNITLEQARKMSNNSKKYMELLDKDQLVLQEDLKTFLAKYTEAAITFPPSYKMSTERNTYNGNRIPGWTDRIFYCTRNEQTKQLSYECDFQVFGSDHRPVLACYETSFVRQTEKYVEVRVSDSRCCLM